MHQFAKLDNMRILSNKEEKIIRSLKQKKYRDALGLFVVEGEKGVLEALASDFKVKQLVSVEPVNLEINEEVELIQCSKLQMDKLSSLKTAPGILALVEFQKNDLSVSNTITLVLDNVQDPGNLGTILRTAEGLGVNNIICSENTVDVYSPKVVQASMGSIFRVKVMYTSLVTFLKNCNVPIYSASLSGESLYSTEFKFPAILVMGSESHGISSSVKAFVSHPINIPMQGKIESFNVAIATGLILSEIQRQLFLQ
tara:strand:+ start:794 stop:1558 length:765 start_codon:yes stop_codon:yes gene_type:complete